jgi:hypothetical protein
MGLFNFFKTKEEPSDFGSDYKLRKFKCDTDKLQVIIDLVKVPFEERDKLWEKTFFENIDTAGFSESIPQIKIGSDGFPYFILKTNEKFNPFESYCIRKIKDEILLERGMGIVLNPDKDSGDWIFTYGDILNYHLNNEFYSVINHKGENEIIDKNSDIMISQPSENYLPEKAKRHIRATMIKGGIAKPKMMMTNRTSGNQMIQELVFNIFMEDFPLESDFKKQMQKLQWYLPKHYIITTVPKKSEISKHLKNF